MSEFKTIGCIALVVVGILLFIFAWPVTMISSGARGVVSSFGAVRSEVLGEGLHFVMPFRDSVHEIDVQTQKTEVDVAAASKDLQTVTTKIALNFHPNPETVNLLFQQVGEDFVGRIISPAVQESVKAATANFTAEELITRRVELKDQVKASLVERLAKNNISVEDVSIINFSFSESFDDAIEAKVTAEQNALAAKNKLEQVKFEAQQSIEKAKAEAESIRIQAQAVTQQGGKDYVQLKAIERWNGVLPGQMVPGSAVPFIDLH